MNRATLLLFSLLACLGGCAVRPDSPAAQVPLDAGLVAVRLNVVETKTDTAGAPVSAARVLDAGSLANETRRIAGDGAIVSYPRLVTRPGRQVEFRSAVNSPAGRSLSRRPATGRAANTDYTPAGAIAKILPTEAGNGEIQLAIDLTFSEVQGERMSPLTHRGVHQLKAGDTLLVELASGEKGATGIRCFISVERGPYP